MNYRLTFLKDSGISFAQIVCGHYLTDCFERFNERNDMLVLLETIEINPKCRFISPVRGLNLIDVHMYKNIMENNALQ